MMSTVLPVLIVASAILLSIWLGHKADGSITAGLYAVALAGVGMLSTLGVTLATDAYVLWLIMQAVLQKWRITQ